MVFTQQIRDCDDHTVTDPVTREVVYGCAVIYGYADDVVIWESHGETDPAVDAAERVNPDYPVEDHRTP